MNFIPAKMQNHHMKTLDLPLKAQWYDQIESGEKKEEYRELTRWILSRILPPPLIKGVDTGRYHFLDAIIAKDYEKANLYLQRWAQEGLLPATVRFRYGYTKRTMLFRLNAIKCGIGNPEWGAPSHEVLILGLGEKLE